MLDNSCQWFHGTHVSCRKFFIENGLNIDCLNKSKRLVVVLLTELKSRARSKRNNSIWNNNNYNPIGCNDDGRNNDSNKSLIIIFLMLHQWLMWIWDTLLDLVPFVLHFSRIPTWVFFTFLSCTNGTKLRKASQSSEGSGKPGKLRELANTSGKPEKSWKHREFCLMAIILIVLKC